MAEPSFDESNRLLAQANLHRMRGQWSEAIAVCMDAMRLSPDSATAHSLLGDIYGEQGNLDEAIRWYCMALDLKPASKSDRAKLSRLVEAKRQSLIAADQNNPHTTLRLRRVNGSLTAEQTRMGHSLVWRADRLIKGATLLVALAMLVTIVAAPIVTQERKHHQDTLGALALTGRQINAAPVYLQPVMPATSGTTESLAAAGPATLRDPFDQGLVDSLRSDTSLLYEGIQIADAQSDPRTGRMVLTFLDNPGNAPAGDLRTQILSNSLRLLAAAASRTQTAQIGQFTIRCLLLSAPVSQDSGAALAPTSNTPISATTPLVFVADIPRSSVPSSDPDGQSSSSMQSLFTSPWFSPSLQ